MYLNDTDKEFHFHGINIYQIKLFLPLYTDDITIFLFSEIADGFQRGLNDACVCVFS